MSLNREEKEFVKSTAAAIIKANMELMARHEREMHELNTISESHRREVAQNIIRLHEESLELSKRLGETEERLHRNTLIGSMKYLWGKYVAS